MSERPEAIPVSVIGGYLGAGKTTLMNQLLRQANGLRFAVLVNEFGELPIDADLIESAADDMIAIAGGCICCSYGSDLMAALMELPQRLPDMDGVLIEASGVALPGGIVSALSLLPEYRVDAVIVLADAETIRARADDRYLADTVRRQLLDADIVLANKSDLITSKSLEDVLDWITQHAPSSKLIATQHCRVPLAALHGAHSTASLMSEGSVKTNPKPHFESDGFVTLSLCPSTTLDLRAVAQALIAADVGLLRAKGFLRSNSGELHTLQIVGQRFDISPAPANVNAGFVCIGMREQLNQDLIARVLGV